MPDEEWDNSRRRTRGRRWRMEERMERERERERASERARDWRAAVGCDALNIAHAHTFLLLFFSFLAAHGSLKLRLVATTERRDNMLYCIVLCCVVLCCYQSRSLSPSPRTACSLQYSGCSFIALHHYSTCSLFVTPSCHGDAPQVSRRTHCCC